jgi:hypothetical protein
MLAKPFRGELIATKAEPARRSRLGMWPQMQAAADKVENVGRLAGAPGPKDLRVKGVDDAPPLLLGAHHPGVVQDAEVVRCVGEDRLQQFREGADGLGSALKVLDDLEAVRFGQRLEALGTIGGLEAVFHQRALWGHAPARRRGTA